MVPMRGELKIYIFQWEYMYAEVKLFKITKMIELWVYLHWLLFIYMHLNTLYLFSVGMFLWFRLGQYLDSKSRPVWHWRLSFYLLEKKRKITGSKNYSLDHLWHSSKDSCNVSWLISSVVLFSVFENALSLRFHQYSYSYVIFISRWGVGK